MIKKIQLITEVDVPNLNNIIYRKEVMEKIVERLNQSKFLPVVININPNEYNNPPVGRVIPETAIFDGKNIYVNIDTDEHILKFINSDEYTIGTYIIASLNENNEVVLDSEFDILELQIIKNQKEKNK
jgi:hypothetical protein